MGAIGGLLGLGGGASGTGFASPAMANIQPGTNVAQVGQGYLQTQDSLRQQQDLLKALQGVGGIQNQQNAFQQMQGTANQYQNIANGIGPNPAQAQLAQNTAGNVAQTGALMAGQRGAAQNVGMIARQAGQQGAQTQQQAVGQAATLGAQQQIAGLQGLQQQQQNIAGVAGQQVGNQVGQTNTVNQANQAQYGTLQNALNALNQNQVASQASVNKENSSLAQNNMGRQGNTLGSIGNAAAAGVHWLTGLAGGGQVGQPSGPQSTLAQYLSGMQMADGGSVPAMVSPGEKYLPPAAVEQVKQGADPMQVGQTIKGTPKVSGAKDSYQNDVVSKNLEPGGIVVPRSKTQSADPSHASMGFVLSILGRRGQK